MHRGVGLSQESTTPRAFLSSGLANQLQVSPQIEVASLTQIESNVTSQQ
jgi:hypothetical protein